MTAQRNKSTWARIESDLEKSRSEANWDRVKDLLDQLQQTSVKPSDFELITKLYYSESKLEKFLTENPFKHKDHSGSYYANAKEQLRVAKDSLEIVSDNIKKAEHTLQAQILLGKLSFITGDYKKALKIYDRLELEELTIESSEISARTLLLIAEAYAIKGFCLERQPPLTTSKTRVAEHWKLVVHYLEKGTEIGLLYLQDQDRQVTRVALTNQQNAVVIEGGLNTLLHDAMQKGPIILMRNGNLLHAIRSYRKYLSSLECYSSYHIRQTLARQLAEILLRGISEHTYTHTYSYSKTAALDDTDGAAAGEGDGADTEHHRGALVPSPAAPQLTITSRTSQDIPVLLAPAHYDTHTERVFVPESITEEIVLLLLISESLANRDAVLSRFPEEEERRVKSIENVTAVYDLLTVCLVRKEQFELLRECFERALRFSFNDFHIWYQLALSLINVGHYQHAVGVLEVCGSLQPANGAVMLLAAKLCYTRLDNVTEGLAWCESCVRLESHPLSARAHLMLGVGCLLNSISQSINSERLMWSRKAVAAFTKSSQLDPDDTLSLYYLALQHALNHDICEAREFAYKCVEQSEGHHIPSLQLLSLLLTCSEQWADALDTIECALLEDDEDISSWHIKMQIERHMCDDSNADALNTCKHLLSLWRHACDTEIRRGGTGGTLSDYLSESGDTVAGVDSLAGGSHPAGPPSVTVSDVYDHADGTTLPIVRSGELALSDTTSTTSRMSHTLSSAPQHILTQHAQIWIQLFDMYLESDMLEDAENCYTEMYRLYRVTVHTAYMQGRLCEYRGDLEQAVSFYKMALAINQQHISTLLHLSVIYVKLEQYDDAERLMRFAVRLQPNNAHAWESLGQVYSNKADHALATQCLHTSVQLQTATPVVDFNTLPKIVL